MSKIINEVGNKYHYLTVVERKGSTSSGKALWLCQCQCGNFTTVTGIDLRGGQVKSCGCYQRERTREASLKDLTGQIIGNFTVLESINGTKYGEKHKWRCRCNLCGNEQVCITPDNLRKQESCGCLVESRGHRKIKEILTKHRIPFVEEKRFADLKFDDSGAQARFDFYVNNKYIIEYDGRQHFIQGTGVYDNLEKFTKTQKHDLIKNNYCIQHNIPIIRIPYTELDNITLEMLQPETSCFLVDTGRAVRGEVVLTSEEGKKRTVTGYKAI